MNHTTFRRAGFHRAGRYSARIVASVAVAALAVTGCSSDAKTSSSTAASAATTGASTAATTAGSTAAAGGATLTIKDFAFSALTAKAGEAITVTNADSAKHTVTADDGSFEVSVPGGGTATLTVAKAGTYAIHCEIHKSMHGSITVG